MTEDDEPDPEPGAAFSHAPVMKEEVLSFLRPEREGAVLYDLTLGAGGHALAFLERAGPDARVFALDGDPAAIERARPRLAPFGERATLVRRNLRDLAAAALEGSWPRPTAVLLDLGVSSPQIDDASRGFSYRREGPLDMRFDPTQGMSAADLLLSLPTRELASSLGELGDEPLALEIVKLVKRRLPVTTTTQLASIVKEAYGDTFSRVHPARRTFQALRILVNDELATLEEGLRAAASLLVPAGRVAVLSYHSGEDRIVKRVLRELAREGELSVLTRRPVRPSDAERRSNQRSRSAKLRAAEKLEAS